MKPINNRHSSHSIIVTSTSKTLEFTARQNQHPQNLYVVFWGNGYHRINTGTVFIRLIDFSKNDLSPLPLFPTYPRSGSRLPTSCSNDLTWVAACAKEPLSSERASPHVSSAAGQVKVINHTGRGCKDVGFTPHSSSPGVAICVPERLDIISSAMAAIARWLLSTQFHSKGLAEFLESGASASEKICKKPPSI